ncbi:hypothetical protein HYH02_002455 [Chlamydomonas schloesseri]|uniref:Crossover junction endonuclease MUS81-like HHH domain-containing protein n=1 Tax=Chlamydomonas schloesseri TaxID=2026947 RepID=A0A836BB00_9CHLO|nr:hypothetical protein HYH02_002455 [Chlamydomonas schloesseri]|eukprot:KAG2453127.1 hypothetical protein HYH02_002455 [Chlamydomonas schloesseri]
MSGRPRRAPKRSKKYDDEVDDFSDADSDVPLSDSDSDRKPRKKAAAAARGKKSLDAFTTDEGWSFEPPSIFYKEYGDAQPGDKIAAFDLDGTLVNTKSGATFAKDDLDWKWYNKSAPEKIQAYADEGYKIVVFTNQGTIKSAVKGKAAEKILARIDSIMEELGVPVQVFACTMDDHYRKPERGMWDFFVSRFNGGVAPDHAKSFFVGDAAGRTADFADTDKGFAENVGIGFRTPEEEFGQADGGKKAAAKKGGGDVGVAVPENQALVDVFDELAQKAFEGSKTDPKAKFKGIALKKAGKALAEFPSQITLANLKEVSSLPGVGKGSIAKIKEFLETGTVVELSGVDDLAGVGKAAPQAADPGKDMAMNFM